MQGLQERRTCRGMMLQGADSVGVSGSGLLGRKRFRV